MNHDRIRRSFLFTGHANGCPGDGFQTSQADFLFADRADAVSPVSDPFDGGLDGSQQLRVYLKQPEIHMDFVVVAGLVHKIPMPRRFHVFPVGFLSRGIDDGVAFLLKGYFEPFEILLFISRASGQNNKM